jgi:hypothetical protein
VSVEGHEIRLSRTDPGMAFGSIENAIEYARSLMATSNFYIAAASFR